MTILFYNPHRGEAAHFNRIISAMLALQCQASTNARPHIGYNPLRWADRSDLKYWKGELRTMGDSQ